ncbi:MAG: hypothetical protein CMG75_09880 [Candidatus Marinimicrobia bacterium]|nr:hypothetical protein [Candidatus Neomarinimicrobiota bacterium]|tara:strand:- start:5607 stop:6350 length:744 start_codon:yes stop_codon:yes gene_type:complete
MIVIVVGMHRSGTSAVAGILHLHGISMGSEKTFRPKALPQNPKGFYENYDFRRLSDKILNRSGYKVKSFNVIIPEKIVADKYNAKMRRLIERQELELNHWGWKDPRICLTLNCWLELLDSMGLLYKTKIVYTYRRADSVSNSLIRRNSLTYKQAINLWCKYNQIALKVINTWELETFCFSYESLLKNPIMVCEKLFQFLKEDLNISVIDSFIDPSLNRSSIDEEKIDDSSATKITEQLRELSADSLG